MIRFRKQFEGQTLDTQSFIVVSKCYSLLNERDGWLVSMNFLTRTRSYIHPNSFKKVNGKCRYTFGIRFRKGKFTILKGWVTQYEVY